MVWALKVAAKLDTEVDVDDSSLSKTLYEELNDAEGEKDEEVLAEELLNSATMMTLPSEKLLKCFEMLVSFPQKGGLNSAKVMNLIANYKHFEKFPCVQALMKFLRGYLPTINCSQFDDQAQCKIFLEKLHLLVRWFFQAFQAVMKNYQTDPNTTIVVAADILATTTLFLQDPFVFKTIQLVTQKKLMSAMKSIFDGLRAVGKLAALTPALQKEFNDLQTTIEMIQRPIERLPLHYFNTIGGLQRRPGIRSLTAIFMCYRVLCPATEIAETIELIATINDYGKTQVVADVIHACLLIIIEEFPDYSHSEGTIHKFNLCNIFFKKFPQVFEILIQRNYISINDVLLGVDHIIRSFKQELDIVDGLIRDNSIFVFMSFFEENKRLTTEMFVRSTHYRNEQLRNNPALKEYSDRKAEIPSGQDEKEKSLVKLATSGKITLATYSKSMKDEKRMDEATYLLLKSSPALLDGCLSWFTVEGNILECTQRMARATLDVEKKFSKDGVNTQEGRDNFAIYFHLLSRISWYYPSLSLEDLVTGGDDANKENLECGFYKWSKTHVMRIVPKEEDLGSANESKMEILDATEVKADLDDEKMDMDEPATEQEPKYSEEMRQKCINLVHRIPFWDLNTQSPMFLIELVPTIGEVWLHENKMKNVEVSVFRELFNTMKEFPVMVLCLCQWLETQPHSIQRYAMARGFLEVITDYQHVIRTSVGASSYAQNPILWQFLWQQCKLHLSEIHELPPIFHPMSVFHKSVANRILPKCGRYQVPSVNMMKDDWIYCQRQNWFSVKALRLVDHLNKSNNARNWINGCMYNAIKLETQDTVAKAIEMMSAAIFLDPVKATMKTIEVVTDLLLLRSEPREPTYSPNKPTIMQTPECTMPVVQAALIIGVWLVNRGNLKIEEPETKKKRRSSLDVEQPWKNLESDESDLDLLNEYIKHAIECFRKEAMNGVMRPASSMIYHMVNVIARSPKNRFRDALIRWIPQEMIFRLAVVDPKALPLEVFAEFCEDQPSHNESQLQYLFLLKKCGGI